MALIYVSGKPRYILPNQRTATTGQLSCRALTRIAYFPKGVYEIPNRSDIRRNDAKKHNKSIHGSILLPEIEQPLSSYAEVPRISQGNEVLAHALKPGHQHSKVRNGEYCEQRLDS